MWRITALNVRLLSWISNLTAFSLLPFPFLLWTPFSSLSCPHPSRIEEHNFLGHPSAEHPNSCTCRWPDVTRLYSPLRDAGACAQLKRPSYNTRKREYILEKHANLQTKSVLYHMQRTQCRISKKESITFPSRAAPASSSKFS